MFERAENPNAQGDIGMGIAINYFVRNKYTVSIPITDSQGYDLIVDKQGVISRVFIRTTTNKSPSGAYEAGLRTQGGNFTRKSKQKLFDNKSCEMVFIACANGDNFLIPSQEMTVKSSITLGEKYLKYKI